MNCKNCGAPLAYLWARACFHCEYCDTYSFPQESADGVTVLGEESDTRCPACEEPLQTAAVAQVPVLYCIKCRGILAQQDRFLDLVTYLRTYASGPVDLPTPIDPGELRRRVPCPHCGRMMEAHPYYGPGNVVIDSCVACGVIWLDHGELRKIRNAPGRDRGRPSDPITGDTQR